MHRMWSSGKAVWRVGNSHTDWIKTAFFLCEMCCGSRLSMEHIIRDLCSQKILASLGIFWEPSILATQMVPGNWVPLPHPSSPWCPQNSVRWVGSYCDCYFTEASKMDWLGDASLVPRNRVMLRVRQDSWSTRLYPILHLPSWCWSNCLAC